VARQPRAAGPQVVPLLKQNGRTLRVASLKYFQADSDRSGWSVRVGFTGNQTQKYLKQWRRRHSAVDLISYVMGGGRISGYAKITHVAAVLDARGATKVTEVTWSGLGHPEISPTASS